MELHLHLSVAFRALDRKWGAPVDLDTSVDRLTCIPAAIERPTATFSSEEYLRTVKASRPRPKPYSRNQCQKRERRDSFSDISMSRIPSTSDLGESAGCSDDSRILHDCQESYDQAKCSSTDIVDSGLQKKKNRIFKQLKSSAFSLVDRKPWKTMRK